MEDNELIKFTVISLTTYYVLNAVFGIEMLLSLVISLSIFSILLFYSEGVDFLNLIILMAVANYIVTMIVKNNLLSISYHPYATILLSAMFTRFYLEYLNTIEKKT